MKIQTMLEKLKGYKAEIAVFTGSGLEGIVTLKNKKTISYDEVGFKYAKIKGHKREFIFGTCNGKKIVKVSRFHLYENGSAENMYLLLTLLYKIGVKTVIATTATGAINKTYQTGDIMLVKDHINLSAHSPLIGQEKIQFVDMTNAYDRDLRSKIKKIAKKLNIKIHEGVHLQTIGPSYETPAEVNAYRTLGADSVSMSGTYVTVLAKYYGMKICEFASITNQAATYHSKKITHEDVLRISENTSEKLHKIISALIDTL